MDATMMLVLDYLIKELNKDEKFLNAIRDWSVRLLIEIIPDLDIPYLYRVYMEIENGKLIDIRVLDPEDEAEADIIITMPLSVYEGMMTGEMSMIKAFLKRKIKVRGKKGELMKRKKALEILNQKMREIMF